MVCHSRTTLHVEINGIVKVLLNFYWNKAWLTSHGVHLDEVHCTKLAGNHNVSIHITVLIKTKLCTEHLQLLYLHKVRVKWKGFIQLFLAKEQAKGKSTGSSHGWRINVSALIYGDSKISARDINILGKCSTTELPP